MTGKSIDGVVQALIEVAVGKVQHLFRGTCPDAIEGFDSRDPQCPACRVLTAAQQQGQAVAFEGTDREVLREFIRMCREDKPVGQWPGERVCAAIERSMANERPFRFIAEADMAPEREPSMKDADRALSGPRRNTAPPPSAPVGVEAIAAEIRASLGRGATVCTRRRWAIELEALAQQPAAVDEADTLLRDLVEALDAAFISSWQSTAAWQKQLDAAREYLAAQHQEPKS